jgi:hypothetical protein
MLLNFFQDAQQRSGASAAAGDDPVDEIVIVVAKRRIHDIVLIGAGSIKMRVYLNRGNRRATIEVRDMSQLAAFVSELGVDSAFAAPRSCA